MCSVCAHCLQWRGLCQVTSELLKQEMGSSDTPPSDELLGNHGDHMTQLWQVADSAISEANCLLDLMTRTSQKLPSDGSKGAGPGYAPGIAHVTRLIEEVENHRRRVGQLAEARKLQAEELKRLYSCERDTKQVWLHCAPFSGSSQLMQLPRVELFSNPKSVQGSSAVA